MPDQETNGTEQNSAIGEGDATNDQPHVAEKDTPTENSATATPETLPKEAQEVMLKSREAATKAFQTIEASATATTKSNGPVTASSSDITDELGSGGLAFGSLLRSVGMGVEDAQTALDKNMLETAKALSETNIRLIAVYEQTIGDDGKMSAGNPIMKELPLINYLMPTAYQFSEVKLFSSMKVSEFNSDSGIKIQQKSSSFNANASGSYSRGRLSIGGSVGYATSNSNLDIDSSYSQDTAAGEIEMEATLKPRNVELPKPLLIQVGPSLDLSAGSRSEIIDPTSKLVTGSQVILIARLTKASGAPNNQKQLSISVDNGLLYTINTAGGKTNAAGELEIAVRRVKTVSDDLTKPLTAQVRVWLNLVTASIEISI